MIEKIIKRLSNKIDTNRPIAVVLIIFIFQILQSISFLGIACGHKVDALILI